MEQLIVTNESSFFQPFPVNFDLNSFFLHSGYLTDQESRGSDPCLPVTCSVVLVSFGEAVAVRVVMGHAVEAVEVLRAADDETAKRLRSVFLPPRSPSLDPKELRQRRDAVRRWLQENRIPVEEEGEELKVAGVLTIAAPYSAQDCRSSNQIILDRIQKLIGIQDCTNQGLPL